jgi:hypothetical protein
MVAPVPAQISKPRARLRTPPRRRFPAHSRPSCKPRLLTASPFGPLIPPQPDVFSRVPRPIHCQPLTPFSAALYFHNLTNPFSSAIDKDLLYLQELTNPFFRNSPVFTFIQNPGGVEVFLSGWSRVTGHESQVTSFHLLAASLASLCALSCTRFLYFQQLAASFRKTPGWGVA